MTRFKQIGLLIALFFSVLSTTVDGQATNVKKVILQGFWWDYHHNDYNARWSDYLMELAPRLKAMGVDAIWIPPSYKNHSLSSVGYAPFDHYDLGDKFQKGDTGTKLGSKDELLRLIAVMHANGIEVIQDIVLNHVTNAGAVNGAGGVDPEPTYSMVTDGGFKNFRYVCYETPVPKTGETANDYLSRKGRWSKNYLNFHPHPGWNVTSGNWESAFWGPDFAYGVDESGTGNGYGQSTNAIYNPVQTNNYNRDQARNWMLWFKKQTDVDGYRWDAVKHFPHFVVQDISYNLKYLNGWANGGETMLNFGEYIGGKTELDNWVNQVSSSNGGSEKLVGAFDFQLRSAFKNITTSLGAYDLAQIPSEQQNERGQFYPSINTYVHRTIPFVNNHDTFRPLKDANGNYIGWDTAHEIGGHIEPNDPRLSVVYALSFALDGNPLIFFEDLFNLGYNSDRYTHDQKDPNSLQSNSDLENIIWCHQNLNFKDGVYKVRGHSGNSNDHLVIERSAKALISVNDNWNTWQTDWVDSDFAPGTVLMDYSGASSNTTTVQGDQRVQISTPPCDGSAANGRRGYAVWAPVGQGGSTYTPQRATSTTQEWEMDDDLGDSHCQSLQQGGKLPDNSTATRNVGRIFAASGQAVTIDLFPNDPTKDITLFLEDADKNSLSSTNGIGTLNLVYTPSQDGWINIKIRNTQANYTGQKCWVKVNYTAPLAVNSANYYVVPDISIWQGGTTSDWTDCDNWENGLLPIGSRDVVIKGNAPTMPIISSTSSCKNLTIESGASLTVQAGKFFNVRGNLIVDGNIDGDCGLVRLNGTTPQTIDGTNATFCNLAISNANHVTLFSNVTVNNNLDLVAGQLLLENSDLTIDPTAQVNVTNGYVRAKANPTSGGHIVRGPSNTALLFPIGTATSYTPLYIKDNVGNATVKVRAFDDVLVNGGSGGQVANINNFVNRTWWVEANTAVHDLSIRFQWSSGDEGSSFNRNNAVANFNNSSTGWAIVNSSSLYGNNPYTIEAAAGASLGYFTIQDNLPTSTNGQGLENIQFSVTPNPTTSSVVLSVNQPLNKVLQLNVVDAQGKVVMEQQGQLEDLNQSLNTKLNNWANGLYFLQIRYEGEVYQLKLVKQ